MVPSATIAPPSSTAIRSASESASSRYWVVRNTVMPDAASSRDDLPHGLSAAGIQPGGRLVEEQHLGRGRAGSRPGRAGGACRPSTWRPGGRPRRRGRSGASSSAARRRACRARHPQQPGDHLQVLAAGLQLVDGGVLAGQADPVADLAALADDVVAGDQRPPAVRRDQRGQDPHGRRLAGAVGPEQREHAAARNPQVDAVEHRVIRRRTCADALASIAISSNMCLLERWLNG